MTGRKVDFSYMYFFLNSCKTVGIFFVIYIAVHLAACTVDPADDNVRKMPKKKEVPKLDRSDYPKVIEDQYCYVCETNV